MSSTLDHVDGYIRYPAPPRQTRLIPKDVVLGRIRERGNLSFTLRERKNCRRDVDRESAYQSRVIGLLRGIPSNRDR